MADGVRTLVKQKSWSGQEANDVRAREKALRRSISESNVLPQKVMDDDMDEVEGAFELGFGFSSVRDSRLCAVFPALEVYYAVNSSPSSWQVGSPGSDDENELKTNIKHWAKAVGWTMRQKLSESP